MANRTQRRRRLLESHARILGAGLLGPSPEPSAGEPIVLSSQPFPAAADGPGSAAAPQASFPVDVQDSGWSADGRPDRAGSESVPPPPPDDVWAEFLDRRVRRCLDRDMPDALRGLVAGLYARRQDPYRLRLCVLSADAGVVSPSVRCFIDADARRRSSAVSENGRR